MRLPCFLCAAALLIAPITLAQSPPPATPTTTTTATPTTTTTTTATPTATPTTTPPQPPPPPVPPTYAPQPGYPAYPPPPGYYPPPPYSAPPPPPPSRPPADAHTHTGFFLRMSLGGGRMSDSATIDGGTFAGGFHASAGALALGLHIASAIRRG